MRGVVAAVLIGAGALNGCGQVVRDERATGGALGTGGNAVASGTGGNAVASGTGGNGVASGTGGSGLVPSKCEMLSDALASEISTAWCTAVVRLDFQSLIPRGHAFVCGQLAAIDEAAARARARSDVLFAGPSSYTGDGDLLSGPASTDFWIFLKSPSDQGGVAAVSAHTGLTVFAGSLVWSGTGEALFPLTWSSKELGAGCHLPGGLARPPAHGFDIRSGARFNAEVPMNIVFDSALPRAFARFGVGIFSVAVLLYPHAVSAFDPNTTEYVVLFSGIKAGG